MESFPSVLNCIGEKVTLPRPDVQSFETANLETENQDVQSISTVDTPVQDVSTDAQVAQPVQVTQSEVHNTESEENPMEVDQCNQFESVDLASSLALSEEAVLLGSLSEDVTR